MCQIFAGQAPERYICQTRSVRLGGHVTSIRLEGAYWDILDEIAAAQDLPLGKFLTMLHDEVMELPGVPGNFTSLLRCACMTYVEEVRAQPEFVAALRREAESDAAAAAP